MTTTSLQSAAVLQKSLRCWNLLIPSTPPGQRSVEVKKATTVRVYVGSPAEFCAVPGAVEQCADVSLHPTSISSAYHTLLMLHTLR